MYSFLRDFHAFILNYLKNQKSQQFVNLNAFLNDQTCSVIPNHFYSFSSGVNINTFPDTFFTKWKIDKSRNQSRPKLYRQIRKTIKTLNKLIHWLFRKRKFSLKRLSNWKFNSDWLTISTNQRVSFHLRVHLRANAWEWDIDLESLE